jgi:hypothetical protein
MGFRACKFVKRKVYTMEFEVEEVVVDISEHFWPFIELLIETNGSDDIRESASYAFLGDVMNFKMSIRGDVLLQDASELGVYTFEDFNKLMYNCRTVLQRRRKVSLAQKVQQALDIMCTQITLEEEIASMYL